MDDTHFATFWAKNTNISVINILGRTEIKLFWKDLSDDIENRNGYEIHEPKKPQQGVRAEKEGFNSKRPQPNFTAVYCLFRFRIVVEVNGTACVLRKNILSIYKYDILYSLRIPFMHIMYFFFSIFVSYFSPSNPPGSSPPCTPHNFLSSVDLVTHCCPYMHGHGATHTEGTTHLKKTDLYLEDIHCKQLFS